MYIWLIAIVVFSALEAFSFSLTTIWMAFGSLLALIAERLGAGIPFQIGIFAVGSATLFICTRPIASKYLKIGAQKTNVDLIIDEECIVTKAINNLEGKGEVKVGGQYWSARSADGKKIPVHTKVKIVKVAGVCAYVKPLEAESEEA